MTTYLFENHLFTIKTLTFESYSSIHLSDILFFPNPNLLLYLHSNILHIEYSIFFKFTHNFHIQLSHNIYMLAIERSNIVPC